MRFRHLFSVLFAALAVTVGCSDSDDGEGTGGSGGSAADGGSVGGSAGSSASAGVDGSTTGGTGGATGGNAGAGPCVPKACQGHVYQCGDCIDNDGDGAIDVGDDPDCLGPCHNSEETFYGSIPGQAGPACTVDCYFDQDSGAGNDGCYWNHKCDPLSKAPDYPPEFDAACECTGPTADWECTASTPGTNEGCYELYQDQLETCDNFCGPLTPNGCDCFGCCELPAGSGKYVWLGTEVNGAGSCDLGSVDDPTKCGACTPVAACLNDCKPCELCLGKTTLPPECTGTDAGTGGAGGSGGSCPTPACNAGQQPCGLDCLDPCPDNQFCLTGCCTPLPT